MTRKNRTSAEWAALIEQMREAGLEPNEFARRYAGMKVKTLRWWMWRLGMNGPTERATGGKPTLKPVVAVSSCVEKAAGVPTWDGEPDRGAAMQLELPGQVVVTSSEAVEVGWLAELCTELERRTCWSYRSR